MSKKDDVEKSLENEIEKYDEFLEGARDIANLVPGVQERKKEAEAKLTFVRHVPEEVFSEFEGQFAEIQAYEEMQVRHYLPIIPRITPDTTRFLMSGTSSTSAYSEIHTTVIQFIPNKGHADWIAPITEAFTTLSEEKAKKERLPAQLNTLNDRLGEMFTVAQASVEKARGGVVGVDQAAVQLRDVIEQLWGGLASLARDNGPGPYSGPRLELKKGKSREIVAGCLSTEDVIKKKLVILLESMASIHSDLSERDFGKNPLNSDLDRLNGLYQRWILVIDDVVNFIQLNIEL